MSERVKLALLAALLPLIAVGVLICLLVLWSVLQMPSPEETYTLIESWFLRYGLPLVFAAALLEGIALINIYIPGSAVIVLGVIFSRGDPNLAFLVVLMATIAFIVTAQINYFLGYFGLHRALLALGGRAFIERAERYWQQYGRMTLPVSFAHPNIGGFVSIAAGNGRFSYTQFLILSVVFICLWNSIWGALTYYFADMIASAATEPMVLLGALIAWAVFSFGITYFRSAK